MIFKYLFDGPEAKIAADKERIATEERELEYVKNVASKCNSLRERLDIKTLEYEAVCGKLDAESSFTAEQFVDNLLLGFKIGDLASRFNEAASLKSNLKAIKADLHKKIIGPAQQALDDFEREHKSILSKLPPPQKMEEPPFVAAKLDHLHFVNGQSSNLAKRAAGIFN